MTKKSKTANPSLWEAARDHVRLHWGTETPDETLAVIAEIETAYGETLNEADKRRLAYGPRP